MFKNLKQLVIQHFWGLAVALICGVILFLPQWWLVRDLGREFQGVVMSEVDNDHYYLSRVSAAHRGDLKITQASIHGTSGVPYTSPPLGENTVAALAHLLGQTPAMTQFFGYFLFPFILGLILYFLSWQVSGSKLIATLAPLGIILGSSIVMDFHQLQYLFTDPSRLWINPYNRPIHPQVSSIYFYSWLSFFYAFLIRPGKIKLAISGLLFGLLFYVYPFSWTVAFTLLGYFVIISLIKKDFERTKILFLMTGIGLVVSIGYWINTWQLARHPLFGVIKEHFVIYSSHEFLWSSLLFVDFLGLVVFFWHKPKDEKFYFFLAMFLSLITVINQQIVTGIRMFPGHWHWYYVVPFSIFFWVYVVLASLRPQRLRKVLAILAVVFLVVFGYTAQRQYYLRFKDSVASYQRFNPVYEWLNANASAGSVVVADDKFSERLPIYGPLYHYTWQGADELYLISNEQIKQGFFVKLYLAGARGDFDRYINVSTPELQILLSGYYRRYADNCDVCYTWEEIAELQQEYQTFLQKDFHAELKRYKVDYAVWDPKGQFQSFDQFDFMKKIGEVGEFKIYQVN